ncbi:MAG: hypothetical protein ACXWLB_13115 [Reyranella sp.]
MLSRADEGRSDLRAILGLGAVLFGAFVTTLNGRLSSLGLADIRGALGLGFDEAAWVTTAQTVAQMMVAPLAVWAAAVLGARRVLIAACVVFATASALTPMSNGIAPLLALQFIGEYSLIDKPAHERPVVVQGSHDHDPRRSSPRIDSAQRVRRASSSCPP